MYFIFHTIKSCSRYDMRDCIYKETHKTSIKKSSKKQKQNKNLSPPFTSLTILLLLLALSLGCWVV